MNFDRFKCLSFDCYGTLIDWEAGLSGALSGVLESHGVSLGREELLERYGEAEAELEGGDFRPYREVLREALVGLAKGTGVEPSSEEVEEFPFTIRDWPAFPDTRETLTRLKEKYRLIVLSNIDDDLFRLSEPALGVEFDEVFTAQQIGSYKPALENFEYLIEHCGVEQQEILHVAQSLYHDIAPAKQLGLTAVWVNRRAGMKGPGATPASDAQADLEVPDLATLALLMGVS